MPRSPGATTPGHHRVAVGRAVLTRPLLLQRCVGVEPNTVEVGQAEGSQRHRGREAAVPPCLKERVTHVSSSPAARPLSVICCHPWPSSSVALGLPLAPLPLPPSILSCNPWILQTCPPSGWYHAPPCSWLSRSWPILARGPPQESLLGSSALFGMTLGLQHFHRRAGSPGDAQMMHPAITSPSTPRWGNISRATTHVPSSPSCCPHLAPQLSTGPHRFLQEYMFVGLAQPGLSPSPESFPRWVPVGREREGERMGRLLGDHHPRSNQPFCWGCSPTHCPQTSSGIFSSSAVTMRGSRISTSKWGSPGGKPAENGIVPISSFGSFLPSRVMASQTPRVEPSLHPRAP